MMSGDLRGQTFAVVDEVLVGRATTCTIFVPDRRASREHARFFLENGELVVEDLGSHNGTWVNTECCERATLQPGDVVRIGVTQFEVELVPEGSNVVRVVSDAHPVEPRLVKPVDPISGPVDPSRMTAQDVFDSLGVGMTERFDDLPVLPLLRKTRSFALLVEASKILQRYTDLCETLPGLLDLVLQAVQGDRAAVMLLDDKGQLIPKVVQKRSSISGPYQAASGQGAATAATPPEQELVLSKTVADMVLQQRCAVITADAAADERFASSESVIINRVRSLLVVPVLVSNRLLGLIEVENFRSVNAFDDNDLHLLSVLGSMLGVALDHLEVLQARERAIVELRVAQDQLLATQQRLIASERMGVLGRLSSGIAHEVKNHLSPFMLADMIAAKYPADQEIQEASQLMLDAQSRILGLVDEIRTFASGAKVDMTVQPEDLAVVLDQVVRFLRCDRILRTADVRLTLLARPLVPMDAARIRQVLINLLRNAGEAIEHRKNGYVELVVRTDARSAMVEVRDNGSGIPQDLRDRVFEPFFTTKGDKGIGLGLDISRQIVRAHGGALTFESDTNFGTVFRMALPLVPELGPSAADFDDMLTDPSGGRLPISLP
ncbi:MAG: FHA domain-containing protein [Deltaproteobacteria bacterium]|nr:FHA domain-containing protein [Deltaproteobacteria bacterium]